MNKLLTHYPESRSQIIDEFIDAFKNKEIRYYLSDFFTAEELNSGLMENAVERATSVCKTLKIPVSLHFKKIYRFHENYINTDWRLSKLGFYLTILNANPCNLKVASLQTSLFRFFGWAN